MIENKSEFDQRDDQNQQIERERIGLQPRPEIEPYGLGDQTSPAGGDRHQRHGCDNAHAAEWNRETEGQRQKYGNVPIPYTRLHAFGKAGQRVG